MAGRIQGITVEIGGDTTKLQTALKGVNTEIRNTQSQLRDVDKLLKLDPGNTELLVQKHRLLGDAVKETKEKLKTVGDSRWRMWIRRSFPSSLLRLKRTIVEVKDGQGSKAGWGRLKSGIGFISLDFVQKL